MLKAKVHRVVEDHATRTCKVCLVEKQLNKDFGYRSWYDTYNHFCKDCDNERRRAIRKGIPIPERFLIKEVKTVLPYNPNLSRKKDRNKDLLSITNWRKTTQANRKRIDYKAVDNKKGFVSDLTIEYIQECLNSCCFYCGYPSVGLDRIDNTKGHLMSNCVPCCLECNVSRNSLFSHEEMKALGKCIKEIKDNRK